ncbi:DUF2141 domain-containing protein [Reichenbachiella versicolor]|uniref:DUF2141 domain-containing protein n=1 Tax=Reichenbachiella versicolor TaxID=1821036 RepID=UPI000D6DE063|nr:DUF2141 domain-containing protein [Reichenbachiella versicolor]
MRTKLITAVIMLGMIATTQAEDLKVVIKNINGKGNVKASLFDSEENFLRKGKRISKAVNEEGDMTIIFKDVTPGTYAVSILHDQNANGKMDKTNYGKPTEPYGFSNNAKGFFGPPSFEDSAFELNTNKTIEITLK